MNKALSLVWLPLLLVLPGPTQASAPPPADRTEVERLAAVCKVWGTVRYLHPYLAYKAIDWDTALVQALPAIRAARNTEKYAAAVGAMLATLGDPATRIVRGASRPEAKAIKPGDNKSFDWVDLRDLSVAINLMRNPRAAAELRQEITRARGVILDFRDQPWPTFALQPAGLTSLLPSRPIQGIGEGKDEVLARAIQYLQEGK